MKNVSDVIDVQAREVTTSWDRFLRGFRQSWRKTGPDVSVVGKVQGYIVAAALWGIALILIGIGVVFAIS